MGEKTVAKLTRYMCTKEGTKGFLEINGITFHTLERPWLNNKRLESCIPEGTYECQMVNSPKFGRVYGVKNVPNRSHILIHAGNYVKDSTGCVLVGLSTSKDEMFIGSSKLALKQLHQMLGEQDFTLTVSGK